MQTSRKLIRKYFHVRVGHKLAGVISQVDTVSLMAARLLGADFTAAFYRSAESGKFIPVSYQFGQHLSIRHFDRIEAAWNAVEPANIRNDLVQVEHGIAGAVSDDFAEGNGLAWRYTICREHDGSYVGLTAYWFDKPAVPDSEAAALLQQLTDIVHSSFSIADQMLMVENYSTRLSELLPLFEAPLSEAKFSDLVNEVLARVADMVPDAYVLLFGRGGATGELAFRQAFGVVQPSQAVIDHALSSVDPLTQVHAVDSDSDGDTHQYRCRDFGDAAALGLQDLVALPLAPTEELQWVLVVGQTGEQPLTQNDRELLSVFAVFAQTVLRNALLVKRLRKANSLLQSSSVRLANAETMAALTDMTSGVAHDFNNIFGGIIGRVQLLRMRLKDNPDAAAELEKIETMVGEGAQTVRRIQEFATSGKSKSSEPVDLCELITAAVSDDDAPWSRVARENSVTVSCTSDLEDAVTTGSEADLSILIGKLIENAVEHSPEGGHVEVSLAEDLDRLEITVTDSGPGIPADIAKKVFYPFFTTKSERGRGLGLAIVQGIVARHSGRVAFDSNPNGGTRFIVTLPRTQDTEEITQITARHKRRENLRILVVDDDDQIRDVLSDMLAISGHRPKACSDGYQALDAFEQEKFDIMITDLGMPGMSGLELAEQVHKKSPEVPIAMITGWGTQLDQREIALNGIRAVLPKPFHLKEIRSLIDELSTA